MTGGNSPAAPVLARAVFLKIKMKFYFNSKQSGSVIFIPIRLITLYYN